MQTFSLVDSNSKLIDDYPNKSYSIVPNDTLDNVPLCSVYFGSGGVVKAMLEFDDIAQTWIVPAGGKIIGRIKRILADGLTAGNMVAIKNIVDSPLQK